MLKLNYDFLKENIVEVEVLKELNMGDDSLSILMEQTNGIIPPNLKINGHDEVIIPVGTKAKFNVQNANYNFEIGINIGWKEIWYDMAFDSDEELNECLKGLNIIGPNRQFIK